MTLIHQAHLLDNFYLGPDSIAVDGTLRHFEVYTLTDYDGQTDYRWATPGSAFTQGGYTSAREAHRAACAVLTTGQEPAAQEPAAEPPLFTISPVPGGFTWTFLSHNGEPLGSAGQTFPTPDAARTAAEEALTNDA